MAISETLNFEIWSILDLKVDQIDQNQNTESLKLPKMTFLDRLNSPKYDFTQNWSGGKIIKSQQSQALTSHFEGFWIIVLWHSVEKQTFTLSTLCL